MTAKPFHDKPCEAEASDDAVEVKGPDDMEFSFSPRAALETAKNLEQAAVDLIVSKASSDTRD